MAASMMTCDESSRVGRRADTPGSQFDDDLSPAPSRSGGPPARSQRRCRSKLDCHLSRGFGGCPVMQISPSQGEGSGKLPGLR